MTRCHTTNQHQHPPTTPTTSTIARLDIYDVSFLPTPPNPILISSPLPLSPPKYLIKAPPTRVPLIEREERLPRRHHVTSCSSILPPFRIPYVRSNPSSHRITDETPPSFGRLLFLQQRYSSYHDPATTSGSRRNSFLRFKVDQPILVKPLCSDPSLLLTWTCFLASRMVLLHLRLERSDTCTKCSDGLRD